MVKSNRSYRFSENSNYLVVLINPKNPKLILFDTETKQEIKTFENLALSNTHTYNVNYKDSYRFSKNSNYLAVMTNSENPKLILFDTETKQEVEIFENLAKSYSNRKNKYNYECSYRFSKSSNYLVVITNFENPKLILFDTKTKQEVKIFENLAISENLNFNDSGEDSYSYDYSYHFSENSNYLVVLMNTYNPKLILFDTKTQQEVKTFENISKSNYYGDYGDDSYSYRNSYHFSENSNLLVILTQEHSQEYSESYPDKLILFEIQTKQIIQIFDDITSSYLYQNDNDSYNQESFYDSYRFSKNSNFLAVLTRYETSREENFMLKLVLFDIQTKQIVKIFDDIIDSNHYDHSWSFQSSYRHSYRFSESLNFLFVSVKEGLVNFNIESKKMYQQFKHQSQPIDIKEAHAAKNFVITTSPHPENKQGKILKITNPNIPQDQVLAYYDKILPPLSEEEKRQYGIGY